jgi:hypothetical protein
VRAPGFHQISIVNGRDEWQKNEGDYFPEWLRQTAVALINPITNVAAALEQAKSGEARGLFGSLHVSWAQPSTDGVVTKTMGCGITVSDKTGLLSYAGCLGWGGAFSAFQDFHGREVARTVQVGSPEVTATVTTLEDLANVAPDFFAADKATGDPSPLHTLVVDELSLRKNLLPTEPLHWPAAKDGPLDGIITTKVVVDRSGHVRDVGSILSDNPAVSEFASKSIWAMKFTPYSENGEPVQVVSRITMPFKTVRPAGVESFESAKSYFEKGRTAGFPAAASSLQPYTLHATFHVKLHDTVQEGQYTDTFQDASHWRREASVSGSRFVRSQQGDQRYELTEGADLYILRIVFRALEPIPAIDTFVESDWRIKRDPYNGVSAVRVFTGYESPEGVPDPEHARGFWFDESGKLLKSISSGLEYGRSDFQDFGGTQVAHQISVLSHGTVAIPITVTRLTPGISADSSSFELRGHKHIRAFTDEVR